MRASSRDQLAIPAILKLGLTHIICLKITWQICGKRLHFSVWADRALAGLLMRGYLVLPTLDGFLPSLGVAEGPGKMIQWVSSLWSGLHSVSIKMEKRDAARTTFIRRKPSLYSQPVLGGEGEGLARKKHHVKLYQAQAKKREININRM